MKRERERESARETLDHVQLISIVTRLHTHAHTWQFNKFSFELYWFHAEEIKTIYAKCRRINYTIYDAAPATFFSAPRTRAFQIRNIPFPCRFVRRDLSSGKRIDRSKSRATNERAKAEQQTQRQSQHQGSAVDADVVTSAPTRIREKQRRVELSDFQMP